MEILGMEPTNFSFSEEKYDIFTSAVYKIPIFKSVLNYYNLDETKFNQPPFYIQGKKFTTKNDFYLFFIRKIRNI